MKRRLLIVLALLLWAAGAAETAELPDLSQVIEETAELPDLSQVIGETEAAATTGRELSGYFGQTISEAAAQVGGLTFEAGEEYADIVEVPFEQVSYSID